MTKTEKQWADFLQYIKDNIGEQSFNTWFVPAKFDQFDGKKLRIIVPTQFFPEYWDAHFSNILKSAIIKIYGQGVLLSYIVKTDSANPSTDIIISGPTLGRADGAKRRTAPDFINEIFTQVPEDLNPNLNPLYTFENFIEGDSNKFPRRIGLTIAEKFQDAFNPIFIFGASGVGKTHLANAIGAKTKELHPNKRVLYLSANLLQIQYTESVRTNKFNDFMNFYQSIDMLIVDDIQEFAGKKATQEAFFNIFNHLQHNHRQLVITCDRPPVLFEGIEERMLTRFKWGMVAELEKPDTQLRRDILTAKIRRDGLSFPVEVVDYIAQNVDSSVRELEGIINGIMAYSVVDDCDIDIDLARRVVARIVNLERKELTAEGILTAVSRHSGVSRRDLCAKSRKQGVVAVRQLAMYLCHKYTGQSYAQIGRIIGGRDHSTVLHGCNQVSRRLQTDRDFRRSIEELEAALRK